MRLFPKISYSWLLFAALHATAAAADSTIQYGGRLTETSGKPLAGPVNIEFRFFDSLANPTGQLGTTITKNAVALKDGVFQVELTFDDADVFGDGTGPVYIETKANGTPYPRQRFTSVPYALRVPVDGTTLAFDPDTGKLKLNGGTVTPGFYLKAGAGGTISWQPGGSGNGDMEAATYDNSGSTANGKVDAAEDSDRLGGQLPAFYAPAVHNHDAAYAAIGHNHNATYSLLGHGHAAGDLSSGQVALNRGGTAADLSASGAGFLKKAAGNNAVTVAALSAGDLPPHNHAGADINSGTLHTDRYSAYDDLTAETKIGTGAAQVAAGNHNHDAAYAAISHTHGSADIDAYADLSAAGKIGTGAAQVAAGNHSHTATDVGLGNVQNTNVLNSFTQNNSQYLATDEIRARDAGGLLLVDDGGIGMLVEDGGNVGIGVADPTAKLHVGGTSVDQSMVSHTGTVQSSSTGNTYAVNQTIGIDLTGASSDAVLGLHNVPHLSGATADPNVNNFFASYNRIDTLAGYTGTIASGAALVASEPYLGGTKKITDYSGLKIDPVGNSATSNSGNTSGTIINRGIMVNGFTAEAAAGGTLLNYGAYINVPNGSGAAGSTTNIGLAIVGNSAAGDENFALYSSSTAPTYLSGNVGIGTDSPDTPLEVNGTIKIKEGSGGGILFADGSTQTTASTSAAACPAGFTSVEFNGKRLGCMQTAEGNGGATLDYESAVEYCFDTFGATLPTTTEWLLTMNNYVLTGETGNWEWNSDLTNTDVHSCTGSSNLTQASGCVDSTPYVVRCWIPGNGAGAGTGGQWSVNGTDVYRNSGNVGIGSTSPSQALDVNGTVKALALLAPGVIAQASNSGSHPATQSITSASYATVTGPSVTLTTSANSKVLIIAHVDMQTVTGAAGASYGHFTIARDGTDLAPDGFGLGFAVSDPGQNLPINMSWIDTPAAGSHTYTMLAKKGGSAPYNIELHEGSAGYIQAIEIRQ